MSNSRPGYSRLALVITLLIIVGLVVVDYLSTLS